MLSLDRLVEQALLEDIHTGDITTQAVVPGRRPAAARLIGKEDLVLAGLFVAERVFRRLDPEVTFTACVAEGSQARKGELLATLEGNAADLLMGERVALNLLQRLSGIATLTSSYIAAVRGT